MMIGKQWNRLPGRLLLFLLPIFLVAGCGTGRSGGANPEEAVQIFMTASEDRDAERVVGVLTERGTHMYVGMLGMSLEGMTRMSGMMGGEQMNEIMEDYRTFRDDHGLQSMEMSAIQGEAGIDYEQLGREYLADADPEVVLEGLYPFFQRIAQEMENEDRAQPGSTTLQEGEISEVSEEGDQAVVTVTSGDQSNQLEVVNRNGGWLIDNFRVE